MSATSDILTGLAQLLDAEGIGTWRADNSAYQADEVAIILGVPPQSPDRVITLAPYSASDDPTLSDTSQAVQLRFRGAPNTGVLPVLGLVDGAFDVLQNRSRFWLGATFVVQCHRQSQAYLGSDENQVGKLNHRHEFTSNYYFDIWRPSPNRT